MRSIGILIFDDVEELDFVGPWEVFTMANEVAQLQSLELPFEVRLIAEKDTPVRCAKGMRVLPDKILAGVEHLDVLLVPGGQGTRREVDNPALTAFITRISSRAEWVTSVCTGALLLTAAGPAQGKRVTTHWAFVEQLSARGEAREVVSGERYVRDGNLVTAAGVSAGIDMALWLVAEICGVDFARIVKKAMQYDPAPPV
ncbi:transcriptional regulator GlxA family with amidase domain [Rhizomicrobium palustre]|uniref:Transcriptional regulator GlxA family with amidase domain n=1 Tax=Rhizomicrobium palustre TaxID=189966 RepID=A0A846MUY4_9PROT|nr:DJ-1/PfpI family protein [Rhizomicrobium palustre]NIK87338.1 transcriptional regulator GlxA family with amidase domain [Rhizomicrobium palustre]